jgi:hypothetical protein
MEDLRRRRAKTDEELEREDEHGEVVELAEAGMKSGMKSTGDRMYAAASPGITLMAAGTRGSRSSRVASLSCCMSERTVLGRVSQVVMPMCVPPLVTVTRGWSG